MVAVRLIALAVALALLTPAFAGAVGLSSQIDQIDGQIESKKEQAQSVQEQLDALKSTLDVAIQEYQAAYAELAKTENDIATTQKELNSAVEQQIYYQKLVNRLIIVAYRDGDVHLIEVLLGTRTFKDFLVRLDYLNKISRREAQVLSAAKRLRQLIQERRANLERQKQRQKELLATIGTRQTEITAGLARQQGLLDTLNKDVAALEEQRTKKEAERQALLASMQSSATGNVLLNIQFPMAAQYSYWYMNDWGFARSGNPSGHQGTDIFAAKGTPLVAVVNGVIGEQFGPSGKGGWRLHLVGDDGVDFYYAHLNNDSPGTDDGLAGGVMAFAPGIAPGVRVAAGQVLGYVGDSGDAETTPPHLHFGITVNGQWVNPYPSLRAADLH